MNNNTLYNGFLISAAIELHQVNGPKFGPLVSAAYELPLIKNFKPNHDPRTEKEYLFFYFMNNEQATSDRVQAKNPQAKRGSLINFFYN